MRVLPAVSTYSVGSFEYITQDSVSMSLHCITLQRDASRKLFNVGLLLWWVPQGLIVCNKAMLATTASEGKDGGME